MAERKSDTDKEYGVLRKLPMNNFRLLFDIKEDKMMSLTTSVVSVTEDWFNKKLDIVIALTLHPDQHEDLLNLKNIQLLQLETLNKNSEIIQSETFEVELEELITKRHYGKTGFVFANVVFAIKSRHRTINENAT